VEVAAGEHLAVCCEHQGIVGHCVRLANEGLASGLDDVEARSHDLRLATQGVGVLHALAVDMRGTDAAAGEQALQRAGDAALSELAPEDMNAIVEGHIAALERIHGQGAGDERSAEHVLDGKKSRERESGVHLRAVEEREPFLRSQLERLQAYAPQSFRGRQYAAGGAHLPDAEESRRKMGKRRQIARGADRALARNARVSPGLEQPGEGEERLRAYARESLREASDLQDQHEP